MNGRTFAAFVCISGILVSAASVDAGPNRRFVDATAASGGDGLSWGTAYDTLQDALAEAASDVTITEVWVAGGVYRPDEGAGVSAGDRGVSFAMRNGLAVYGGFAGGESSLDERDLLVNECVLDGDIGTALDATDNSYHVVDAFGVDGTGRLDGFVVRNGTADGSGDDAFGGGLFGGGITVANGSFISNKATFGGAIHVNDFPSLINVVLVNNEATSGDGGAIRVLEGSPTLVNCTMAANTASGSSGGIYVESTADGLTDISNTILWGNTDDGTGSTESAQVFTEGPAVTISFSDVQGLSVYSGSDNIDADPMFADLAGGDVSLTMGSACLDAGDETLLPVGVDRDRVSHLRVVNATDPTMSGMAEVDLGAIEFNSGRDCNANDIPDPTDIAVCSGDLACGDCNMNGVPDGCEVNPTTDCQGNGLLDVCELAEFFCTVGCRSDCNDNDVPDVCEALTSRLYVDADVSGANDGSSWTDALTEARLATCYASDPLVGVTEIWVASANGYEYTPDVPGGDRTATFRLTSNVSMYGGFAGGETSVDERDPVANPTVLSGDLSQNDGSDCCYGHGAPGCSDTDCENSIGDPFCNNVYWDDLCAETAITACKTNCTGTERDDNSYHVVTALNTVDALLDGFTIRAGNADGASLADQRGAGMVIERSDVTVRDCRLESNAAQRNGGGLHVRESPASTIDSCVVVDNLAGGDALGIGGGISLRLSGPTIQSSTVTLNAALDNGGGMHSDQSAADVINVDFIANVAEFGGGVYTLLNGQFGQRTEYDGCTFVDNRGRVSGGGAFNESSSPTYNACVFEDNRAGFSGIVPFDGVCEAPDRIGFGGGMKNCDADTTIDGCTFLSNEAESRGGGVDNDFNSSSVITGTGFLSNSASDGGGLFNRASDVTVDGCDFESNSATRGGGVFHVDGDVAVSNTGFVTNSAVDDGGAVHGSGEGKVTLLNTMANGNDATNGGAVWSDSPLVAINSTFVGNTASDGGAIHIHDTTTVTNCSVADNRATGSGGGVLVSGGTLLATNDIFFFNVDAGGADESAQIHVTVAPMDVGVDFSCIQGLSGSFGPDNISSNPDFTANPDDGGDGWGVGGNDDYGDLRLASASLCIDSGDNTAETDADDPVDQPISDIAFDIRNDDILFPRIVDDICSAGSSIDMGAYEASQDKSALTPLLLVDALASPGGDGQFTWSNALTHLEDALEAAERCPLVEEIWIAGGAGRVYTPIRPTDAMDVRTVTFNLVNNVVIRGGFEGTEDPLTYNPVGRDVSLFPTILSGDLLGNDGADLACGSVPDASRADNAYHVVTANGDIDGTAVLEGVVIERGVADGADAGSTDAGGGIYVAGGGPTIVACTMRQNFANLGGGLYAGLSASPHVVDTRFEENFASDTGGAAYGDGSSLCLNASEFAENCAADGGAVRADASQTNAFDCMFSDNGDANTVNGGAVYVSGGGLYLFNTVFDQNTAQFGGGVATDGGASVAIDSCDFLNHTGVEDGGAVSNEGSATCDVRRSTFDGNAAKNGGAVFNALATVLTIEDSTFSDNQALGDVGGGVGGGAILNTGTDSELSVDRSGFYGNSAVSDDGGAIRNSAGASLDVLNSVFSGNTADRGGAIDNTSIATNLRIINGTIAANTATIGGGVANNSANLSVYNGIVWGNTPDAISGSSTTVQHSCVEGGFSGPGNSTADPLFVDLDGDDNVVGTVDDNFEPTDATCIDSANVNLLPNDMDFDFRALPRLVDDSLTSPNTGVGALTYLDRGAIEVLRGDYVNGVAIPADMPPDAPVLIVPSGLSPDPLATPFVLISSLVEDRGSHADIVRSSESILETGFAFLPVPATDSVIVNAPLDRGDFLMTVVIPTDYDVAASRMGAFNHETDDWLIAVDDNVAPDGLAIDDCNGNGVADDCDIAAGTSVDTNGNGIPDECDDCDDNGVLDSDQIAMNPTLDRNRDGLLDACAPAGVFQELADPPSIDLALVEGFHDLGIGQHGVVFDSMAETAFVWANVNHDGLFRPVEEAPVVECTRDCDCYLSAVDFADILGTPPSNLLDVCDYHYCDNNKCTSCTRRYGNTCASFGGFVQTADILCAVAGFGNYCACPNADVVDTSQPGCSSSATSANCKGPSGTPLSTADILAIVAAFGGANPFSCPVPSPSSCDDNPPPDADACGSAALSVAYPADMHVVTERDFAVKESGSPTMTMVPRARQVRAGDDIAVDVFVAGVEDLIGYEFGATIGGMESSELTLRRVHVDHDRSDFVFAGLTSFPATDATLGRIGGVAMNAAISVAPGESRYLGTLTFGTPTSARGTVEIVAMTEFLALHTSIGRVVPTVDPISTSVVARSNANAARPVRPIEQVTPASH